MAIALERSTSTKTTSTTTTDRSYSMRASILEIHPFAAPAGTL
jgi:hypothetical protein